MTAATAQLMLRALRSFEQELGARLHASGWTDVTVAHTNLLRHLNPEGMRLGALAADAGVTKQAASQGVKPLVQRGLVELKPDPDDGRARRVVYTDRGRALIVDAIAHIAAIEQEWTDRLGPEAYAALRAGLAGLLD